MSDGLRCYREIWLLDFEFRCPDGERPEVRCLVAREWRSGTTYRLWADELHRMGHPPFSLGANVLCVAYYSSAEWGCFLTLDWELPRRVVDLFCEFRCLTNGTQPASGSGLLGALIHYGLSAMGAIEKQELRELAMRPGPTHGYTNAERESLLDYCESDVVALGRLLTVMEPHIDLPRALLRGRYMTAVAQMERSGTPIDVETLDRLRAKWSDLKDRLVECVDRDYGVFVPTRGRLDFKTRGGQEVLLTAQRAGVDPHLLGQVAEDVRRRDVSLRADHVHALRESRRRTGLSHKKIQQWEDHGKDHSSWPGLDVLARSLAGELPELGIGMGYSSESGYDDSDYAGRLWELLRDTGDRLPRRFDTHYLEQATEILAEEDHTERGRGPWTFSLDAFSRWLASQNIPWPRTEAGKLALDDDTFREMARAYPKVAPLRELRTTLGSMRLFSDLAVGSDGRNRCLLSPFRASSSRNAPSNARFIFGPSCWLRSLIRPQTGRALAYVDWEQQEFGIGAALSRDQAMMAASRSDDPYMTFAIQAGAVPRGSTKQTHPRERELFKTCCLGVQYGMESDSLGRRLGIPPVMARELLQLHRQVYATFWAWNQRAIDHAMLHGYLQTVFGWRIQVRGHANLRSLGNFPCQANGAEMLRLACCLLTEAEIVVCCPIHDAILSESSDDDIEQTVTSTQALMAEASRVVLNGFELRSEAKIVRANERYSDKRGVAMWDQVMGILAEFEIDQRRRRGDDF